MFGFFVIISHLVQFLDQCWILHLPRFVILLLEQSIFFLLKNLLGALEFELGALNEQVGFLEAGATLLPLVLELGIQGVVDHESLMDREFASHAHEIADPLIQVAELRDLRFLENKLLQIIEFGAQAEVGVRQLLGHELHLLASLGYLPIDPLVLRIECVEVVGELLGHV